MSGYASNEYIKSKKWISQKIQEGFDWESVKHFCVTPDKEYETFEYLQEEEAIIPQNMDFEEWPIFVAEVQKGYSVIGDMYGISAGGSDCQLCGQGRKQQYHYHCVDRDCLY